MKDAFGNKLQEGDRVIYSVKSGGGTEYAIGTIRLMPGKRGDPVKWGSGNGRTDN